MPDKRGETLQFLIKREVTPAQTDIKIHTMSALMWLYLNIKDKKKRKVIIEIIGKNIATINRLDGIQDSMQEFVDLS